MDAIRVMSATHSPSRVEPMFANSCDDYKPEYVLTEHEARIFEIRTTRTDPRGGDLWPEYESKYYAFDRDVQNTIDNVIRCQTESIATAAGAKVKEAERQLAAMAKIGQRVHDRLTEYNSMTLWQKIVHAFKGDPLWKNTLSCMAHTYKTCASRLIS